METLPRSLLPFFLHFLRRYKGRVILMQLLFLTWSLDLSLWPVLSGHLIDGMKAMMDGPRSLWPLMDTIIGLIVLWVGTQGAFIIGGFIWADIVPKIEADMRMEMFNYAQGHSHTFFGNNLTGSLAYNINAMVNGFTGILNTVMQAILPTLGMFIISIGLFIWYSPWFGAILFFWLSLHLSVCIYTAKKCAQMAEKHGNARSILQGTIVDSLNNYVAVKLFAHEKAESQYVGRRQNDEIKTFINSELYVEKVRIVLGQITFWGAGVLFHAYLFYEWSIGRMTPGDVIFAINTNWTAIMMAWWIGTSLPPLYTLWGICRQALKMIEQPHEIVDETGAKELKVKEGGIIFDKITFGYDDRTLFEDKTLVIEPKQKVGLVGFSGAGKTTLVNLLLRFYDLHDGRIMIDHQDIATTTLQSLRKNISVIPQDPLLFNRSILDNIRYSDPTASEERVRQAAIDADCDAFIRSLPHGYNTVLGKHGVRLSGGQRQRIAIARAFFADAPILVLDEATSALDSVTERQIHHSLKKLMQGRTVLTIAHRLSTLRGMDRIIVFEKGRIVEDGTHADLLARNGVYASMWKIQANTGV